MPRGSIYTKAQNEFIQENWQKMSDREIGKIFGKTESAIANRRFRIGINRPKVLPVKSIIRYGFSEVNQMRALYHAHQDMKALIILCQLETNLYKREKYINELKKMSFVRW